MKLDTVVTGPVSLRFGVVWFVLKEIARLDVGEFLLPGRVAVPHRPLFERDAFHRIVDEGFEFGRPQLALEVALDGLNIVAIPHFGFLVGQRRVFDRQLDRFGPLRLVQPDLPEIAVMNAILTQILFHAVVVLQLLRATRRRTEMASSLQERRKITLNHFNVCAMQESGADILGSGRFTS